MGIRETFVNWLLRGGVIQQVKGVSGLDMMIGADAKAWYPKTDFISLSSEGYEYNAVIYACITELMTAMEEAPFLVEKLNRAGEWEEQPDHSLARLLDAPNPEMSEDDLQSVSTLYLKLAGNCFWEKERSPAGRVVRLWPMRPDQVGIIAATSLPGQRVKKRILAYTWRGQGGLVTLPAKDVIHLKEYHPRDDLFGLPPLAAAAREGDTDNKATNFVGSFFNNAAVPKGILRVTQRIDEAEEKRLKERMQQLYTGSTGWHDPLILGEGAEWTELGESFRDMDFPNLRMITETRLCSIFKVPPIVAGVYAGVEKGTYANYAEARRQFVQGTVVPMNRDFDTVFTRTLAWEWGREYRIRSDTSQIAALHEDMNAVWERATKAFEAGAITVNDFREEVGLERVENGDVFLRGMMVTEIPGKPEGKIAVTGRGEVKVWPAPEDHLERQYKAFDTIARAWQARFREEARKLFAEELDAILAILKRRGKAAMQGDPFASFLIEVTAYLVTRKTPWAERFFGLMAGLMAAQVEELGAVLGFAFDVARPEVQEFLEGYTIRFAQAVCDETASLITDLVADAQAEGWSVPHLRGELMSRFEEMDRVRAERIARTETIRSSNAGTHEAWQLAGIERTQWYASIDGRQCPFCEDMHNRYGPGTNGISVTENYASVGDVLEVDMGEGKTKTMTVSYGNVPYPPLHVGCRCTILAVTE